MAKGKSGKEKQDMVISQFRKDIYQMENRTWLTAVEQAILQGQKQKAQSVNRVQDVHRSFYNPNNPLNGSSSWTKQQWAEYREKVKAEQKSKSNK